MNQNIDQQKNYLDKEVINFDSIFSHKKSKFKNYLDKKLRWEMNERFNFTIKKSEPIEDKVILDVGCSTGRFFFEFIKRKAKKVIGIVIAPSIIKTCENSANEKKVIDKCEFYVADPTEFKADITFDPVPVIKRMSELTKRKIVLSFPKTGSFRALIRKIRLNSRGCDFYSFSPKQIENIFKECGIEKYDFDKFGELYFITAYCN